MWFVCLDKIQAEILFLKFKVATFGKWRIGRMEVSPRQRVLIRFDSDVFEIKEHEIMIRENDLNLRYLGELLTVKK